MVRYSILLVLFCGSSTLAGDAFTLFNTHYRAVTFQFFQIEQQSRWLDKPYEAIPESGVSVFLSSEQPHTLFVHDDSGMSERLDGINFHEILAMSDDRVIQLTQLYRTETHTREIAATKMRTDQRTRLVPVTRYESVERKGIQNRRDAITGRVYQVEVTRTVQVPVTVMIEQSYTVAVPYTETVTQEYSVSVPLGHRLSVVTNGERRELELPAVAMDVSDKRQRKLGVTLRDTGNGALVTSVEGQSAATRLRLLDPMQKDSRNYRIVPGRNIIDQVNGAQVATVADVLAAIQSSPPIVVLGIRDIERDTSATFEARLEMAP